MRYDEQGRELPDPTPVEIPVGFQRPESLQEQIKRLVRTELSAQAQAEGFESFEEADDFEVGDDYDPSSPHELDDAQESAPLPELSPKPGEKPVDKPVDKGVVTPPPLDKTPSNTSTGESPQK